MKMNIIILTENYFDLLLLCIWVGLVALSNSEKNIGNWNNNKREAYYYYIMCKIISRLNKIIEIVAL